MKKKKRRIKNEYYIETRRISFPSWNKLYQDGDVANSQTPPEDGDVDLHIDRGIVLHQNGEVVLHQLVPVTFKNNPVA